MKKQVVILIYILSIVSCKQEPSFIVEEGNSVQPASEITKKDIKAIEYTEYGISPDVEKATANWITYNDLKLYMEDLKEGDLSFFKGDAQMISTMFNDLKLDIPKALKTNPIRSRILVLETKTLKANSLLKLNSIDKKEKIESIKDMLIAMSHFNDQMNKKFEIENNNILIGN